jgi:hypothetical protein
VAKLATTFVRAAIVAAYIVTAAILFGLLSNDTWYRCIEFATLVVGAVLGFQWLTGARDKELARECAWLALRTLVLKSEEVERFKIACSTRNPDEVQKAKEGVLAAIRSLQ